VVKWFSSLEFQTAGLAKKNSKIAWIHINSILTYVLHEYNLLIIIIIWYRKWINSFIMGNNDCIILNCRRYKIEIKDY